MNVLAHLTQKRLALYADGALPPKAMRRASAHLSRCATCRAESQRFAQVVTVARTPPSVPEVDLLAVLRQQGAPGRPPAPLADRSAASGRRAPMARDWASRWSRRTRRSAVAASLLVMVGTGIGRMATRGETDVRPRSGAAGEEIRWTGITAFRARGDAPPKALDPKVEPSFAPDDALVFSYVNGSTTPFPYLMIYGVDVTGAVHWYYPAFERAEDNPRSVAIAPGPGPTPLPDAIRQELAAGPFVLHAVFSREPLYSKDVEASLAMGLGVNRIAPDAVEQVMALNVR